jgi:hypothetical protein
MVTRAAEGNVFQRASAWLGRMLTCLLRGRFQAIQRRVLENVFERIEAWRSRTWTKLGWSLKVCTHLEGDDSLSTYLQFEKDLCSYGQSCTVRARWKLP